MTGILSTTHSTMPRQTHECEFYLTKAQRNAKITKYLFDIFFVT